MWIVVKVYDGIKKAIDKKLGRKESIKEGRVGNIKKYIESEDSRSLVFYLSLYTLVLMDNLIKVGAIHLHCSTPNYCY